MNKENIESTSAPRRKQSRVAVAECLSYSPGAVAAALLEVLETIGGLSAFVKPGQTVLVNPNLFSIHPPEQAVTTHPELIRQIVLQCVKAGADPVWVGDSPVGSQNEGELWVRTGMVAAIEGTPAAMKSWRVKQKPLRCGDDLLAVPAWYDDVDVVISVPKLKTHSLTTLTCGLKNVYGIVSGEAKIQFHLKYPSPLAMSAFLLRVFSVLKPQLTIADAVIGMEGNGPVHGRPLTVGVLLASSDTLALDTVACRTLGISPSAVPMISLAADLDLGCLDESLIDCTGSGLSRIREANMKPSISRFWEYIPETLFRLSAFLWQIRPKIVHRHCSQCGNCAETCPANTIESQKKTGYPRILRKNCIGCFCCLESCPEGAIALQLYFGSWFCVARKSRRKVGTG
ncbi:MAG: DUF362 domain-containing protein [Acidobacteriota bacterium]